MDVNCLATCCAIVYFQKFGLDFHIEGWEKVMKPNHCEFLGVGNDLDVNMDNVNLKMEGCELIGMVNLKI